MEPLKGYLLGLLLVCITATTSANNVKTYIPKNAYDHLDTLMLETAKIYPNHPFPPYTAALIEHESCITLKRKRCWSPTSRLKTSREEGAGLGQLTRAYRKNGTLRFDTLTRLSKKYSYLKTLNWNNVYSRPDLQIRAILALWKENYEKLPKDISVIERIAMTDAAYNGGYRGLYKDRMLCKVKKGCDPKKWFTNVEKTCSKSKRILYGDRSACDINRYHVRDVLTIRLPKYAYYWIGKGWKISS